MILEGNHITCCASADARKRNEGKGLTIGRISNLSGLFMSSGNDILHWYIRRFFPFARIFSFQLLRAISSMLGIVL